MTAPLSTAVSRIFSEEESLGQQTTNRIRYIFAAVYLVGALAVARTTFQLVINPVILLAYLSITATQTVVNRKCGATARRRMQLISIAFDFLLVTGLLLVYQYSEAAGNFAYSLKNIMVTAYFPVLALTALQFRRSAVGLGLALALVFYFGLLTAGLFTEMPLTQDWREFVLGDAVVLPAVVTIIPGSLICVAVVIIHLLARSNHMVTSIAHNEAQLRTKNDELSALFNLSHSLLETIDVDETLELALGRALDGTGTQAGSILLLNSQSNDLVVRKSVGLPDEMVGNRFPVDGKSASGYAILRKEPVWTSDVLAERSFRVPPAIERAGVRANLAVPMLIEDRPIGAIVVDSFSHREFDSGHIRVVRAIANQTAVALERARLFNDLSEAYDRTLDSLVAALDARDKETEGHSRRVVAFTVALARRLHVAQHDMPTVRRGALLHDIGKIAVPDAILHKPGPLTDEEWRTMKRHPQWGADILRGIPFLESAVQVLLAHHERWDGGGYPRELEAERIPLGARIFALADTLDAITSDRPYRAAQPFIKAREEIARGSGTQFDPQVVDAFLEMPETEWALLRSQSGESLSRSQDPIA